MTVWLFALVLALMAVTAAALVIWPLLRARPTAGGASSRSANVAVYRRRLAELEADLTAGALNRERFDEARAELDRALLEDTSGPTERADTRASGSPRAAVLTAVLVPALATGLYLWLGDPGAVAPAPQVPSIDDPRAFIADNLEALEARAAANPGDARAWEMLGVAYLALERGQDAVRAFAEAMRIGGERPSLLVQQARGLAVANGGRFGAEARDHLRRALELAPSYPRALWFAGLAAVQADEPERARQVWSRLAAQAPPGSEVAAMLRQAIADLPGADSPATAGGAAVRVQVSLPKELREGLPPETAVFVFARAAEGPAMPLAVQRLTVAELPATVRLDDSMAMRPGLALSNFERVEIVARVSRSGRAQAAPGDIEGYIGPVPVGGEEPVDVVIDHRLDSHPR